jgi:hypothetical protein
VLAAANAQDGSVLDEGTADRDGRTKREDPMVPGITDTECRIAQFRYRALHAEAERQRQAAHAAPVSADRAGVMETMHRHIGALMERASRILTSVRTQQITEHAVAPGTLAVSK